VAITPIEKIGRTYTVATQDGRRFEVLIMVMAKAMPVWAAPSGDAIGE
jgi:hypothetical protein